MRAVVHHGPGAKAWEDAPDPVLQDDTDAIVRVAASTICGTDLHILHGDATVREDTVLGHEAVGTVQVVGSAVCDVTHHFTMAEVMEAYDTFARAAETGALEVVVER